MENFRVCFERSFELVIRAEDEGLLTAVLADMTDYDINDLAGYGGGEVETAGALVSGKAVKPKGRMGVCTTKS